MWHEDTVWHHIKTLCGIGARRYLIEMPYGIALRHHMASNPGATCNREVHVAYVGPSSIMLMIMGTMWHKAVIWHYIEVSLGNMGVCVMLCV